MARSTFSPSASIWLSDWGVKSVVRRHCSFRGILDTDASLFASSNGVLRRKPCLCVRRVVLLLVLCLWKPVLTFVPTHGLVGYSSTSPCLTSSFYAPADTVFVLFLIEATLLPAVEILPLLLPFQCSFLSSLHDQFLIFHFLARMSSYLSTFLAHINSDFPCSVSVLVIIRT